MRLDDIINRLCAEGGHETAVGDWEVHDSFSRLDVQKGSVVVKVAAKRQVPSLMAAISEKLVPRWQEAARMYVLANQVMLMKHRIGELERTAPLVVPIDTLAPEPYEVVKTFHVVLHPEDDEWLASFYDANLSACGETQGEALLNLKDLIVAAFEMLSEHDQDKLGPGPKQQLDVLKEFVRSTK